MTEVIWPSNASRRGWESGYFAARLRSASSQHSLLRKTMPHFGHIQSVSESPLRPAFRHRLSPHRYSVRNLPGSGHVLRLENVVKSLLGDPLLLQRRRTIHLPVTCLQFTLCSSSPGLTSGGLSPEAAFKSPDKRCASVEFCITRGVVASIGPWSDGAVEQRPGHDHQLPEGARVRHSGDGSVDPLRIRLGE